MTGRNRSPAGDDGEARPPSEQPTNHGDPEPDRGMRADDGATEFLCAECGEVAGRLRVVAGGDIVDDDSVAGQWRLNGPVTVLSGFIGVITTVVSDAGYDSLHRLLGEQGPLTRDVADIGVDLVPFFCRQCRRTYCRSHWDLWQDSPTSVVIGYCPNRHRQLVDD